jgi:hypothetical protein
MNWRHIGAFGRSAGQGNDRQDDQNFLQASNKDQNINKERECSARVRETINASLLPSHKDKLVVQALTHTPYNLSTSSDRGMCLSVGIVMESTQRNLGNTGADICKLVLESLKC